MDYSENNRVSPFQAQALIILNVFGAGVVTLPRVAASYAGRDAWLCVVIAAAVAAVIAILLAKLSKYYDDSFPRKPIGIIVCSLLTAKAVWSAAWGLRFFGTVVKAVMLPRTPFWAVAAAMTAIAAYAASRGIEPRARLAQALIVVALAPFVFVMCVVAADADFTRLVPAFQTPAEGVLTGSAAALAAFSGVELIFPAGRFVDGRGGLSRRIGSAVALTGILMAATTAVCVADSGAALLAKKTWPVISMMDAADMPGSLLERQGSLMMGFWIISVFALTNAYLFYSSVMLEGMIGRMSRRKYVIITAAAVLALALATGCWDSVDIEKRAFVTAVGVDSDGGSLKLSYAPEGLEGSDSLYFGHVKLCVLGEGVPAGEAAELLAGLPEINMKTVVLRTAGSAAGTVSGGEGPGMFAADYYGGSGKDEYRPDIQTLLSASAEGGAADIPALIRNGDDYSIVP
ncbi:MAG: GerAB/ArcD/ProY family transporter [Clostridiales bacterium]|jgi:spore germination protein|nr:GerAB/ArcD/ProY family transporter [Clostridiales bacterium]